MRSSLIFTFLFVCRLLSYSQTASINIACAPSPQIDGTVSQGEWDGADTLRVYLTATKSVKVYFMRDLKNLYFLFAGNLESQIKFPEILFDINNSKSSNWEGDDWWFHVSATDCESQGAYGVYNQCQLVQPDWEAVNNITQGAPITDTVEIAIPLVKIGYADGGNNIIGICFNLSGITTASYAWPLNANKNVPSTWAEAVILNPFCDLTSLSKVEMGSYFSVFTNPDGDSITMDMGDDTAGLYDIAIRDIAGNIMYSKSGITAKKTTIRIDLIPGLYLFSITRFNTVIKTIKFITN